MDLLNVISINAQKRLSNDMSDPHATLITRRALQVLGAILDEYSTKIIATTTVVMIEVGGWEFCWLTFWLILCSS
jgi:hypothetical protein